MSESVIGVARPRIDAPDKVTGATRYAADGRVHGLLHARLVLSTGGACADPADRAATRRSPCRASSPCSSPKTSRSRRPARTGRRSRSRARRSSSRDSRSRMVVAESEAAAEDGARGRRRRVRAARGGRRRRGGDAAGAARSPASPTRSDGRRRPRVDPRRRRTTVRRTTRTSSSPGTSSTPSRSARVTRRPLSRRATRSSPGRSGRRGYTRRTSSRRSATAWLEPNGGLVVSTSTQGTFVTQRELARAFGASAGADPRGRGAARRRVRRQVRPRGAARGRRGARARPPGACRLHARRGLPGDEPGLRAGDPMSRIGARKDGTLTAITARMIVDRGSNAGWGVEGITSLLVAGPYRWEAHDLRGYGVQTNRFTFGAYRGPGAPTAAFALETLLDELAARARPRPARAPPAKRGRRGRRRRQRESLPAMGAVEVLERIREHPLWQARDSLPDEKASGSPSATGRGATEPAAAVCRVNQDGTMTVVTSAVDMSGVEHGLRRDRRGGLRPLARPGAGRSGRHGHRSVRRRERRLQGHVHGRHGRAASGGGRAREAARGRVGGARDRSGGPRGRGRRGARGRARPTLDHGRGDRRQGAPLRRPLRADRGARRLGADARRAVGRSAPRARPRRPRDRRGRAPRATSSPRTSVGR